MSDLRDDLHDAARAAWDAGELPPELLVPDEYLWNCLHHPDVYPSAHLNLQHIEGHACETVNDRVCFTGSILREGDAFYRIAEYEILTNCWWARWPD